MVIASQSLMEVCNAIQHYSVFVLNVELILDCSCRQRTRDYLRGDQDDGPYCHRYHHGYDDGEGADLGPVDLCPKRSEGYLDKRRIDRWG